MVHTRAEPSDAHTVHYRVQPYEAVDRHPVLCVCLAPRGLSFVMFVLLLMPPHVLVHISGVALVASRPLAIPAREEHMLKLCISDLRLLHLMTSNLEEIISGTTTRVKMQ
ncbi:hypothetical protein N9L68_06520 [bacterium]|nr:hypothetical protein [bacterium]